MAGNKEKLVLDISGGISKRLDAIRGPVKKQETVMRAVKQFLNIQEAEQAFRRDHPGKRVHKQVIFEVEHEEEETSGPQVMRY